ncbi:hypothetical protein GCM10025779_00660 [Arthrobacter cryoconiti]
MKTYDIESHGSQNWEVEAHKYSLTDGYFNFFGTGETKVFTISSSVVQSVRVRPASK